MKKSFLLYKDQEEIIDNLTDKQAGRLFKAVFDYARGDKPVLSQSMSVIFISIRQTIDRNKENYEKVCEINRKNAKKRWEKIPTNTKVSDGMRPHAKAYDSDSDSDSDSDKSLTASLPPGIQELSSLLGNKFKFENKIAYRLLKKGWEPILNPLSYLLKVKSKMGSFKNTPPVPEEIKSHDQYTDEEIFKKVYAKE